VADPKLKGTRLLRVYEDRGTREARPEAGRLNEGKPQLTQRWIGQSPPGSITQSGIRRPWHFGHGGLMAWPEKFCQAGGWNSERPREAEVERESSWRMPSSFSQVVVQSPVLAGFSNLIGAGNPIANKLIRAPRRPPDVIPDDLVHARRHRVPAPVPLDYAFSTQPGERSRAEPGDSCEFAKGASGVWHGEKIPWL